MAARLLSIHASPGGTLSAVVGMLLVATAPGAFAAPGPPPAGYTLVRVSDAVSSASLFGISQLAFKPADTSHLYAARAGAGAVTRYDYNAATGQLSNPLDVATSLTTPIGLAFRGEALYVSTNAPNDSRISRLRDLDHDGVFEERFDFVRGVPNKDHGIDQIQITGSMLFTTIGTRTNSGAPGCETAYTGTIARIADLDQIDYAGGGNYLPSEADFVNSAPGDGMLRRYAFGFRNPFGIRLDAGGHVWVSDNGASFCNTCSACNNFAADTPDFLYREVPPGARGNFPPPGYPGGGGATITPNATLATHAAATGLAWIGTGPHAGQVLVAQYGATDPGTPIGRDIVRVDPSSGVVTPFITGFARPIDIVADANGRLLIADYATPAVYLLTPPGLVGVEHAPRPAPRVPQIRRITPNPTGDAVTIEYTLPREATVTMQIIDAAGRYLAALSAGRLPAGTHTARWDGRDDRGGRAPAGMYFCSIECDGLKATRGFVRVR